MQCCYRQSQKRMVKINLGQDQTNGMAVKEDNPKEAAKEMLDTQMVKSIAEHQRGIEDQEQKEVRLRKM